MTMRVRALWTAMAVLATMGFAGCDHYVCSSGATFNNTGCTSSGGQTLSTGTGQGAASAYVFSATAGTINEDSFDVSAGTLTAATNFTGPTTPNGSYAAAVAQGTYLYTTYGVGEIYGWTIGSDGSLTAISGSPFPAPYMTGGTYTPPQALITNPAGTLLFVQNQLNDAVYVYQIGTGGVITLTAQSPVLLPFLPGNMATDGLGKYLYISDVVSGDATNEIAAYSINSTTGALTAVSGSPFTSTGSSLEFSMFQLQGESSGKYMIGTTAGISFGGDLHLYVFNIQQSGTNAGAISPVTGSPFTTIYSPYRIIVQPSAGGNLVYSFSIDSTGTDNPIEGFTLNTSTGALSEISGSPFSTISATGDGAQFDQSGSYLFVYDSDNSVMSVFSIASGGVLAQPTATSSFPTGPWAVADVP